MRAAVASRELHGIPVKTEHAGAPVGKIVSTLVGAKGELRCVLEIDENSLPGSLAGGFVRDGVAGELSLGYSVDVRHAAGGERLRAGDKRVLEVSLVRKGARNGCHITAWEDPGRNVVYTGRGEDCWSVFDLNG